MRLVVEPATKPLAGRLTPPGDKSISHRALILAGLAAGQSRLGGLLDAADTNATRSALAQLGAQFSRTSDAMLVEGTGTSGLTPPSGPLYMGNSGTAMRLLSGVLAAQPFDTVLTGDASLSSRPMRRIIEPLQQMGATIRPGPGHTAPLAITGGRLRAIEYRSPLASAQVKSCILLAGLYADGLTRVVEPVASRDHTERMLPSFGVELAGACAVAGGSRLRAGVVDVPADPSSAAFLMAAALLVEGSEITLSRVGLNRTRTGFFKAAEAMGASIEIQSAGLLGPEPVGDVRVRHRGRLQAIDLPQEWVPSMIDELPVLMALAAKARGVTRVRGAGELRVKESDRIAVMCGGLRRLGVDLAESSAGFDITGTDNVRAGTVDAAGDHRCAMSFAILGLAAAGSLHIGDSSRIDTSYPGFVTDLQALGGRIAMERGDDH